MPGSIHGDLLEVHAQFAFAGGDGEEAAHGLALLGDLSFDGDELADVFARAFYERRYLDRLCTPEVPELAGHAERVPQHEAADCNRDGCDRDNGFHLITPERALRA